MDGYYNNGSNFNYGGYSQQPSNNGNNCPGGSCPRITDHGQGKAQGQGRGLDMGSQSSCPGGQCCINGQCSIGRSGSKPNWQNYGR
ncbi:hypothetical protein KR032_008407 [Drosophila birchii]|nr:hypothetical protein KR032_008407 [Drosophila birchii]